jgi:hypothetical protein
MRMEIKQTLRGVKNRVLLKLWQLRFRDIWYRPRIRAIRGVSARQKKARGIKRTVRLVSNFRGLWQRNIEQTPNGSCQWGGSLFVAEGPADHYVILNSIFNASGEPFDPGLVLPEPERVWGLHMEPEEYIRLLRYDQPPLPSLVSRLYTNSARLLHEGGVYRPSPPYVHFHLGKSWDFLARAPAPHKTINLGIITSDLNNIEGHKLRQKFLAQIDASGIDVAIWGRGEGLKRFRNYRGFVLNKWDALARCRYSIVMENSISELYWSEKIADSLLCYSLPFYHGCPELGRFLPSDSFIALDINEPGCIDRVRDILDSRPYEDKLPAIESARSLLLNTQNLYAFLDRELEAL